MKHEYTDEQIRNAFEAAHSIVARTQSRVTLLLAFLEALPEPDSGDEWQECEFSDYRPGDQMMWEAPNVKVTQKVPVKSIHGNRVVLTDQHVIFEDEGCTYYRIPAPVVHPDPEEHHLIGSVEYYDADDPDYAELGHANGNDYMLFNNGVFEATVSPEEILNWVPVRVIVDE